MIVFSAHLYYFQLHYKWLLSLSITVWILLILYLMILILLKRYIWIYDNGIGLENGTYEIFSPVSEIIEIGLRKKKNSYTFILKTDGGKKHSRDHIGEGFEDLKNILEKHFRDKLKVQN